MWADRNIISNESINNENSINKSIGNSWEFYMLVKFTFLSLFAIASTLTSISSVITVYFSVNPYNYDKNGLLVMIVYKSTAFDTIVNCICMIWQYAFYDKTYMLLCGKCHMFCAHLWKPNHFKTPDLQVVQISKEII